MKKDFPSFQRRSLFLASAVAVAMLALSFAAPVAFAQGTSAKPKLGLVGSGNVGSNLARAWNRAGYEVMLSSRDLEADKKLAASIGGKTRAGTPQEAAAFGEVLVFAVPYGAQPELGQTLGKALAGKVVIDASNPFPARDGAIAEEAREKGAGIVSARLLPGARIVRAFNAIPAARMSVGHEAPGRVGVPISGDDKQALEVASRLIRDIGFEPVVVGGVAMGKFLVPGTPLAGEHSPAEIRTIAATLKP